MTEQDSIPPPPLDTVTAFDDALVAQGTVRVAHDVLRGLWNVVDPAWAGTTGGRVRLAAALDVLARTGSLELPRSGGRLWERALPPLPASVTVPANRRPREPATDPSSVPWAPAMEWAGPWIRDARPAQRLRRAAVQINEWLLRTTRRNVAWVAREERSLHIFQDEKMLAVLAAGALFDRDRLTLADLRCDAPSGALPVARLVPAGPVLVVENKSTFDSVVRALRAVSDPPFAAVVFGSGDAVLGMVEDLVRLPTVLAVRPTTFWYAGDVDRAGVETAHAFTVAGRGAGLHVEMLTPLWDAVARAEPTGDDLTSSTDLQVTIGLSRVLGLPGSVQHRLQDGVRVPQERIDRSRLAGLGWWTATVRPT